MARQIGKALDANLGVVPAALTASANETGQDCSGYEEVVYTLHIGAVSGTSPTLDVKIQESATVGGTYTDITGATFAQQTAANYAEVISVRVNAAKPFQRIVTTIAGTSPSFTGGIARWKANPVLLPAAAPSAT